MAPPLKPFTEGQREAGGFGSINDFFKRPPKPGRPRGNLQHNSGIQHDTQLMEHDMSPPRIVLPRNTGWVNPTDELTLSI